MPNTQNKLLCIIIICNLVQFHHCLDITEDLQKLKDILNDITEYVKVTVIEDQAHCVQMQCKFVCFNGRINNIVSDIKKSQEYTNETCPILDELCIYNYEFPNDKIYRNFLGEYGTKIKKLYIATSNVVDIEGGAFANGIFTKLSFEKLKLITLRKDFFQDISSSFQSLAVIQKDLHIRSVNDDFLDYVKYQIKSLTVQVGIPCVRNLTSSANLLNSLKNVDFSFNDFRKGLLPSCFSKLSVVEELDISDSHIAHLPENIFADIMAYLQLLDLTNNHLTTISSNIFSWKPIPPDLKIIVTNNMWDCSCDLKTQMDVIFYHQQTKIFCSTPERYANWSVFDNELCNLNSSGESVIRTTAIPDVTDTTFIIKLTSCKTIKCNDDIGNGIGIVTPQYTTSSYENTTTTAIVGDVNSPGGGGSVDSDIAQLTCYGNLMDLVPPAIKKPTLLFEITTRPSYFVDVIISSVGLNSSYGLIWFSKVTTQYYKMEINYNEYGLGCYGTVAVITTVENLLPNVAYTFCLTLRDQLTISPFSCKSIHINGNLGVSYSAWLTKDMRATGVSLAVIGIVIFTFIGILIIYQLLKRKPTLLKGSKRVATTNGNSGEIIVYPKDKTKEDFWHKEQMLAKRNSKSAISYGKRRNSTESIDSNQSYMNANLYEVIPAYLKFNDDQFKYKEFNIYQSSTEYLDSYISPLTTTASDDSLVRYVEIPSRAKRISNDPLPEVPADDAPPALPLSECPDTMEDTNVEYIITLDSEV